MNSPFKQANVKLSMNTNNLIFQQHPFGFIVAVRNSELFSRKTDMIQLNIWNVSNEPENNLNWKYKFLERFLKYISITTKANAFAINPMKTTLVDSV